jgi:hypothetical protein
MSAAKATSCGVIKQRLWKLLSQIYWLLLARAVSLLFIFSIAGGLQIMGYQGINIKKLGRQLCCPRIVSDHTSDSINIGVGLKSEASTFATLG